jgi:neutral ceramidase
VGTAKASLTPSYAVRLNGHANRNSATDTVATPLFAKAIALRWQTEPPLLLMVVDNWGLTAAIRNQVLAELASMGLSNERFTLCSSRTNSAPAVTGSLPNLFAEPLSKADLAEIDRYTRDLCKTLVQAGRTALADRVDCKLETSLAKMTFGQTDMRPYANRPVPTLAPDHDLPILRIIDQAGQVLALFMSYACQNNTIATNSINSDWSGQAQLRIELALPKSLCLVAMGCAGDQLPHPRGGTNDVRTHGHTFASAVLRSVNSGHWRSLEMPVTAELKTIELPFKPIPKLERWQQIERTTHNPWLRARAAYCISELKAGRTLPTTLPYTIQVLGFGGTLAMVFLNGEVVSDYSLQLKQRYDPQSLWIQSYSNDVQAYLPSDAQITAGGPASDGTNVLHRHPAGLDQGIQDQILTSIESMLPAKLPKKAASKKTPALGSQSQP